MRYEFRPLGLWTDKVTENPRGAHLFKAGWQPTLDLLDREITHLGGDMAVIQADVKDGEIRRDGMLSARARVGFRGVRVSFESQHGPLTYATDAYERQHGFGLQSWQANVRAIALALEALRAVDRYGVTHSGEQYTGFTPIEARPAHSFANLDAAAQFIAEHTGVEGLNPVDLLHGANDGVKTAFRLAARRLHPDAGGDSSQMARLNEAYRMLGGGQ